MYVFRYFCTFDNSSAVEDHAAPARRCGGLAGWRCCAELPAMSYILHSPGQTQDRTHSRLMLAQTRYFWCRDANNNTPAPPRCCIRSLSESVDVDIYNSFLLLNFSCP